MSIPEYVFIHRVQEFYDQLRAGKNLWKIDETLNFIDEKGREIVKRWIQDERYKWTLGRGYSVLTQPPPLISLVVDGDHDRPSGQVLGNYADDGISYNEDGIAQEYWQQNVRLKTGTFLFVLIAPNSDMLNAMYCLLERALYEGESAPINETGIISFENYGITELSYSGSDIRPDQNYAPTSTFARTLSVSCTYPHNWSGRIFGTDGYAFSVDFGDIYEDGIQEQQNPLIVNGERVLDPSQSVVYNDLPGVSLSAVSFGSLAPVIMTTNGDIPRIDNLLFVPQNTALIFDASIGAVTTSGSAAGLWRFAGVIRRETTTYSTKLVGVTTPTVVADAQFAQTYVEVYENTSIGALMISVSGAPNMELYWNANVQIKEIK
jgi:hypothetical protein